MKKFTFLSLLLVSIMFSNCSKDEVSTAESAPNEQKDVYFPLKQGSTWEYESKGGPDGDSDNSRAVAGTFDIDSRTYVKVDETSSQSDSIVSLYYRNDSEGDAYMQVSALFSAFDMISENTQGLPFEIENTYTFHQNEIKIIDADQVVGSPWAVTINASTVFKGAGTEGFPGFETLITYKYENVGFLDSYEVNGNTYTDILEMKQTIIIDFQIPPGLPVSNALSDQTIETKLYYAKGVGLISDNAEVQGQNVGLELKSHSVN